MVLVLALVIVCRLWFRLPQSWLADLDFFGLSSTLSVGIIPMSGVDLIPTLRAGHSKRISYIPLSSKKKAKAL